MIVNELEMDYRSDPSIYDTDYTPAKGSSMITTPLKRSCGVARLSSPEIIKLISNNHVCTKTHNLQGMPLRMQVCPLIRLHVQ